MVSKGDPPSAVAPVSFLEVSSSLICRPWELVDIHPTNNYKSDDGDPPISSMIETITSLFLIPIQALLTCRSKKSPIVPTHNNIATTIPSNIPRLLQSYVSYIASKHHTSLPFHSFHKTTHTFLSAYKILSLLLQSPSSTFGISSSPLLQIAFLFAVLIHDVDHQGVSNRELIEEEDDLTILYNDRSVLEHNSLFVAFEALLDDKYVELRECLFGGCAEGCEGYMVEYEYFRRVVIDLVLCTDIGSHEQVQLVKSKWKEAFGETTEQKMIREVIKKRSIGILSPEDKDEHDDQEKNEAKEEWARRSSDSQAIVTETGSSHLHGEGRPLLATFFSNRASMSHMSFPSDIIRDEDEGFSSDADSWISYSPSCSSADEGDEDDNNPACGVDLDNSRRLKHHQNTTRERRRVSDGSINFVNKQRRRRSGHAEPSPGLTMSGELSLAEQSIRRRNSSERCVSLDNYSTLSCRRENSIPSNQSSNAFSSRKIPRRLSAPFLPSMIPKASYLVRLGIRRALDFTGSSIEMYPRKRDTTNSPNNPSSPKNYDLEHNKKEEEIDPLRSTAILELLIRAVDVSHSMQSYPIFIKWSSRLFLEQKNFYESGRLCRGDMDPSLNWYNNQITFLDSYAMPLARRMDECGVFGKFGQEFKNFVEENRYTWIEEGMGVTREMIDKRDREKLEE